MSVWQPGSTYDYYGQPVICVARYFAGNMEMVDLAVPVAAGEALTTFTRTARTLAPCVSPRVTETLGGVTRAEFCHHDWYGSHRANAGPHNGLVCCEACGAPIETDCATGAESGE